MPAWSPVIASLVLTVGRREGVIIDQMRLQRLVYIAHGFRLATSGEPLTGDRPEAWEFGPVYRRLADATAHAGQEPVEQLAGVVEHWSELDSSERDLVAEIVEAAGSLPLARLSAITRGEDSPWRVVYAGGKGRNRDIGHNLIKEQFESFNEDWLTKSDAQARER